MSDFQKFFASPDHFLDIKIMFYIKRTDHRSCNSTTQTDYYLDEQDSTVKFPHVLESVEHLKGLKSSFKPSLLISKNRKSLFTIGLSTIKRENISYLNIMLDSLFLSMSQFEKEQVLVVILLAEVILLITD